MTYDVTTSKHWCDECDDVESVHECSCGKGFCAECYSNNETCVKCGEKTCFNCDVLTEDGHMHKSCRDLEPEDKETQDECG